MPLLIRPTNRPRQSGFSLIWVSVLLTAGAIVFASMLPGQDAADYNHKAILTMQRLQKIEEATRGFIAANGRRPCPADGQYDINNANFGVEAATPGTCTGGTPSAPLGPDAGTGNVVGGVVPTKTLGLSDDYAFDEFGRRFAYMVDKRATDSGACYTLQNYPTNNGTGGIQIKNAAGAVTDNVMAAYASYGPDGFGAFPLQGSSVANRINTGSADADTLVNAGVDSNFVYNTTNFTRAKIRKDRTSTFDDLVYYRADLKNTCCFGSHCTPAIPPVAGFRIDGVAASDYSGYAVATGDVNGDGIPDIVIGAYNASPGGRATAGTAYVVFGNASGILVLPTQACAVQDNSRGKWDCRG